MKRRENGAGRAAVSEAEDGATTCGQGRVAHLVDVNCLELLFEGLVGVLHGGNGVGGLLKPVLREHDLIHVELLVDRLLLLPLIHFLLLQDRHRSLLDGLLGGAGFHLLHLIRVAC